MMDADGFLGTLKDAGFRFFAGVPCSYFTSLVNGTIDDPELRYIGAANEGEALSIAVGGQLGGIKSVAMMQNSGLGNAINPLTSLAVTFKVPVLIIVTLRGDPEGEADEPQHELMGAITTKLLEECAIRWRYFVSEPQAFSDLVAEANAYMQSTSLPFAIVMKKGALAKRSLKTKPSPRSLTAKPAKIPSLDNLPSRQEALMTLRAHVRATDAVVATTGYTGRELYALGDTANQFYMVGSMGCASSIGLGLAFAKQNRRIIVLDGDGAVLMRMGALATIGYERPSNLLHILLDNGAHESTGAQATVSGSVDFCAIAAACGYARVIDTANTADLSALLQEKETQGPIFMRLRTRLGVPDDLPRPSMLPHEVATRFAAFVAS